MCNDCDWVVGISRAGEHRDTRAMIPAHSSGVDPNLGHARTRSAAGRRRTEIYKVITNSFILPKAGSLASMLPFFPYRNDRFFFFFFFLLPSNSLTTRKDGKNNYEFGAKIEVH